VLASGGASAHTPYQQWVVYRRKHLLVGTCRADPAGYELGKRLVAMLERELPEAKARVTRAPDQERLASLLTTGQISTILLRPGEAQALRAGEAPFAQYGPFALVALAAVEDYCLVSADDFPAHHAWLLARALFSTHSDRATRALLDDGRLPLHSSALAFLAGAPIPDPPAAAAEEHDHGHGNGHTHVRGGGQ
jgi:hypothetical protein